jgi:hypothetical protein
MSNPSFLSNTEEIKREINHVQSLILSTQRNLSILEGIITRQGVANVDLYFRKAALEDDLAQLHNRLHNAEARKQEASIDESLQVSVEVLYTHLPSGVLALYNPQTMPLLKYDILNNTEHPIELVLQSEIEDFSFSFSDSVQVSPKLEETFYQLPPLKADKVKALTEGTKAVVHTSVKGLRNRGANTDKPKDFEVYLMARNVIRWAVPDVAKGFGYISLLDHIAAWVTPHTKLVTQTLRDAADYPPLSFDGYPKAHDPEFVRSQISAIYQMLQKKVQLAYINSPFAVGPNNGEERQTVRLPDESLRARSANCVDGAVLYASLIELASLEPVIVFLKDHALVGWKTGAGSNTYEFLDTTMTRDILFEDALDRGTGRYQQLVREGWFNRDVFDPAGFARLLDVKALHISGIHPME